MEYEFVYDERLGIRLPYLYAEWETYARETQAEILFEWEAIRGTIPERIEELENEINEKQARLGQEEDFATSCQLNSEISELASIINDLWIWFRTRQTIEMTDEKNGTNE